jgi:hypothetical protein
MLHAEGGGRSRSSLRSGLRHTAGVDDQASAEQAGDESTESSRDRRIRRGLSAAISIGALALAAAHVIWPHARLDAITVILIAVALVPWLGSIFKSIKLPWFEVQYRELKARQEELHSRLAAVETRMFQYAGATPAQEALLDDALREYAQYLDELGFELQHDLPRIAVDAELPLEGPPGIQAPATNTISLALDAADDVTVALRQYTHSVLVAALNADKLMKLIRKAPADWDWSLPPPLGHVEDGLADYFVASHLDVPVLGSKTASRRGRPFFRDLAAQVDLDAIPEGPPSWMTPGENPWGNLFWAIRTIVGRRPTDVILAECWRSTDLDRNFDQSFIAQVLDNTPDNLRASVTHLLTRRGAPVRSHV